MISLAWKETTQTKFTRMSAVVMAKKARKVKQKRNETT